LPNPRQANSATQHTRLSRFVHLICTDVRVSRNLPNPYVILMGVDGLDSHSVPTTAGAAGQSMEDAGQPGPGQGPPGASLPGILAITICWDSFFPLPVRSGMAESRTRTDAT
jgi:hypothetical protein